MPYGSPNAGLLTRPTCAAILANAGVDGLRDVKTAGGEWQAMEVSGKSVRFLLPVRDSAGRAAAVHPHAQLLVQDLLMREAIAVELDARYGAEAAVLTLDESRIVVGGRERESGGRKEEQGEEGKEGINEGLHCEVGVVYGGRSDRVSVVFHAMKD